MKISVLFRKFLGYPIRPKFRGESDIYHFFGFCLQIKDFYV